LQNRYHAIGALEELEGWTDQRCSRRGESFRPVRPLMKREGASTRGNSRLMTSSLSAPPASLPPHGQPWRGAPDELRPCLLADQADRRRVPADLARRDRDAPDATPPTGPTPTCSASPEAKTMPDATHQARAGHAVARHLTRGAIGFGLIGSAIALAPSLGPAALLLAPGGMVALRGCPTCWVAGLVETVSAGRVQRTCTDDGCELHASPAHAKNGAPPHAGH
jgi:hypothetical protein